MTDERKKREVRKADIRIEQWNMDHWQEIRKGYESTADALKWLASFDAADGEKYRIIDVKCEKTIAVEKIEKRRLV